MTNVFKQQMRSAAFNFVEIVIDCVSRKEIAMTIVIPAVYFESLTNWSSIYDIMEVHPYLTVQQARLACNFHKVHDVGRKATMLFNIVSSMVKHSKLTNDQYLFIAEFVNFDKNIRTDLVEAFNRVRTIRASDIVLQLGDLDG